MFVEECSLNELHYYRMVNAMDCGLYAFPWLTTMFCIVTKSLNQHGLEDFYSLRFATFLFLLFYSNLKINTLRIKNKQSF